jgi:hypothetical protein
MRAGGATGREGRRRLPVGRTSCRRPSAPAPRPWWASPDGKEALGPTRVWSTGLPDPTRSRFDRRPVGRRISLSAAISPPLTYRTQRRAGGLPRFPRAYIGGQIGRGFLRHLATSSRGNGCNAQISLKNRLVRSSGWLHRSLSARQSWASAPHVAKMGVGRGMSFANFLRFWAVAANRNSSLAPFGPRRRNRSSLRMRFK